ncbi:hypothetical protein I4U23_025970 [Adineta vaga]|nr:hypothetical protein I4U23_025970 [Adineta vaga]
MKLVSRLPTVNSSTMELNNENDDKFDDLYRELTFTDVNQALYTLKINQTSCENHSNIELLTILHKQERDCCCLLRSNPSSGSFLPLARRGRPHFSSRSHRSLCTKCTEIKHQQQLDIVKNSQTNQIFQITINLSLSSDEQNALNDNQYHSNHMLVWKINTSDGNMTDLSCDTDSLNETEKKFLIEETIRKLQTILNSRSTTIADTNANHIDFTYRTLQTTLNILSSSSHNSI